MSLDYSFTDIKNYKEVVWIPTGETNEDGEPLNRMNPVTEVLIFGTMSIGIGKFTDKNIDEVAARFRIIEQIDGPFIHKLEDGHRKDRLLTDEEFIAHIGLGTNVPNETRAQWTRRIFVNKQTSKTEQIARNFRSGRSRVEMAS